MEAKIIEEVKHIKEKLLKDVQRLVAIDSTEQEAIEGAPFGQGVKEALLEALTISEELGFETVNVDNYMGYARYGQSEAYIGIIGHIDIVPVGTGWKHDPFSGYIENNKMYGRGVLDNKGPILACLYALYILKELGIEMSHEVRILFGCDEETGFKDLEYYLSKEKPPIMGFTPDCKYPVVYGERGRATFKISTEKENVETFFCYLNTYFMNAKNNGETLGIDYHDEEFGTLEMRGYQLGSEDNELSFQFSVSYPAGTTLENIQTQIESKCPYPVKCLQHYLPVKFEKESFLVKSLQEAYEKVMGEEGSPVTTTGGTYAKLMPNIVPFGPSFPGQKGIAHLPNEWMDIDDIMKNVEIYALSMYYLNGVKEK